ncbi:transglutaminase domain-containing protein [Chitinophaga arvensicola]|uniref:Transglutaminase-like superfamily protein n=1 Tax=Chitinophaga arvensicola TaxID=29529 RepID=A0A1I0SCV9_9BACT|nr:transglutaminase domain-containing protein [Chitinophaga arvensicola]SEW55275.1 Transglutaminase-like superfamily protein [Chitinophaga arvensicola]
MKASLILLLCACFFLPASSQQYNTAISIPDSVPANTASIAQWINANCHSEEEKLSVAYQWVCKYINYDIRHAYSLKHQIQGDTLTLVNQILKTRKAVCIGYACTFSEICKQLAIPVKVVTGYGFDAKQHLLDAPHAWVTVHTGGKWLFVDPTWGAGFAEVKKRKFLWKTFKRDVFVLKFNWHYFLMPGDEFIADHVPYDPLYQFTEYPVRHDTISKKSRRVDSSLQAFKYIDTLQYCRNLNYAQRSMNEIARIRAYGVSNRFVSQYISIQRQNIPYWKLVDDKASGHFDLYQEAGISLQQLDNDYRMLESQVYDNSQDDDKIISQLGKLSPEVDKLLQKMESLTLTTTSLKFQLAGDIRRVRFLQQRLAAQQAFVQKRILKKMERKNG